MTIADISQDNLTTQAATFAQAGEQVETIILDVSDRAQVEATFDQLETSGGVDILVTAAAIVKAAPILDLTQMIGIAS